MRPASWFVTLAMGAAILAYAAGPAFALATVGQPAPALVVPELNGQAFDLAKLRGKVVIVSFWATWCPPCRKEMPALNAFYRQYHDRGLDVIGLSADRPRDRSDAIKVMQSFSYPAAMLHDAKANGFGEPSELPTTYVVDAQGIVRAKLTPNEKPVTEQALAAVVLPLLPQRTAKQGSMQGH
ncbi:MAG TPA: redoxin domain-containing protein [Candidatus Binataceae bacterium]|nr:redoxin domain-containing protein [Candidatus Binataceae bacterium]